jgi:hypothetical protein
MPATYETHDFCGITIYHCPHCKFDDESIPRLREHIWHRHELPARLAAAAEEEPQAELYDARGERVTRIERG